MRRRMTTIGLLFLSLNTGWFVVYSAQLGLGGMISDAPEALSRVFASGDVLANTALALHMIAGAVLTVGAPLQAVPAVNRRWPRLHRAAGYALFGLALATGFGGLTYIGLNGTVGGAWMSLWFGVYGAALMVAATMSVRFARRRDFDRHVAWVTRFVILAVGSWIYRMHYALWYALTDGAGSNDDFDGTFDRIQVIAFFVPYLAIAELVLRRRARRRSGPGGSASVEGLS